MSGKYKAVNALEVEPAVRILLPEPLAFLNPFFGSIKRPGLVRGGSYFITGAPNAGKSSILLQILDAFAAVGHKGTLDSTEMLLAEITDRRNEMRLLNDIDIRGADSDTDDRDIRELITGGHSSLDRDQEFLLELWRQAQELSEHFCVASVVDSIQSMNGGRGETLDFVRRAIAVNQKVKGILFLVGQVRKDGEAAGFKEIPHLTTAHLHIDVFSNGENDQVRSLELRKNRAGPCKTITTKLGELGHSLWEAPDESEKLSA